MKLLSYQIRILLGLHSFHVLTSHQPLRPLATDGRQTFMDIPCPCWFTKFQSYLSSRCQFVLCNGAMSSIKFIRHGVPQGSILGPLLFLLFINDLPNASKLPNFLLFADDNSILASHKSYDQLFSMVNLELGYVNNWFRANKLSLNVMKSNYILFTSRHKQIPPTEGILKISDVPIPVVSNFLQLSFLVFTLIVTLLGIIIQIASKVAKNIGILSRISYLLPSNIRINLCYTMIHPYLAYCNLVWASNYQAYLKRLIVLQNRVIRVIIGCFNVSCSTDSLYKQLRILKIGQITTFQIN